MGNLCARPKAKETPKPAGGGAAGGSTGAAGGSSGAAGGSGEGAPTTPPPATLSSILGSTTILEIIDEVKYENITNSIFVAKISLSIDDADKVNEIRNQLSASVLSKNLRTKGEVKGELLDIINNINIQGLTEDVANYYLSLELFLTNYTIGINPSSENNQLLLQRIRASSRTYAFQNPRNGRGAAFVAIVNEICAIGNSYDLTCSTDPVIPPPDITTEQFRNKKVKNNNFIGYSLEYSPLLPKDYAEF